MHLANNVTGLKPSATLAINEMISELKQKGENIFHLGFGEAPFPVHPSVQQALCDNAWRKSYFPTQGILQLREQIAKFYKHCFGLNYSPEQIIIGPGSKMLMYTALACLSGPLFLPAPSWVTYQHQAHFISKDLYHIPTNAENSYRLTAEELEIAVQQHAPDKSQQKMLLINYPCNPTGHTFTPNNLVELADVARRNNIIILSDEIYALVSFTEQNHQSIAKFYPEGTLVFGGISKDRSLGGYRVGVMLLPKEEDALLRAITSIGSETWSCVPAPVQFAAIEAYKTTEILEYVKDCTAIHEIILNYSHNKLVEAGIRCPKPLGAFYLFPDWNNHREKMQLNGITTSNDIAEKLLREYNVATLPGSEFGMSPDNLCIRIAVVDYDGTNALQEYTQDRQKAMNNPDEYVKSIAPRLIDAFQKISEFTHSVMKR